MIKNRTKEAVLVGDVAVDLIKNISFPAPDTSGSCSGGQLDWETVGIENPTISFEQNELFLQGQARFQLSSSNAMEVRLIRDGNTGSPIASLTTAIVTSGQWVLSHTILNEIVGAHTYEWQIRNTNNPGETSCVYNARFFNLIAEADTSGQSGEAKKTNQIIMG